VPKLRTVDPRAVDYERDVFRAHARA
jgi:hypothetical protein